jgi:hypothetical protein
LRAQLPVETTVLERIRVRLTDADVTFENAQSLILLEGRATAVAAPESFADFTLAGGLHDIHVDPESGRLAGRVALDHIELRRVASERMEPGLARTLVEGLAGSGLGAIGEVVPPIEMPTRLEREIESGGYDDGRMRVAPARLPLRMAVRRVIPVKGRLWILLDVKAGR